MSFALRPHNTPLQIASEPPPVQSQVFEPWAQISTASHTPPVTHTPRDHRDPQETAFENPSRANPNNGYVFEVQNQNHRLMISETLPFRPSGSGQENATDKDNIKLIVQPEDLETMPQKEIDFAQKTIEHREKTGVWPPQFAVLDRQEGVSADTLKALDALPVSAIKTLGKEFIYDLSNKDYKPYHGKEDTKIIAPIMTAKVASGDTLMVQYGLEREAQKGDILFIDDSGLKQEHQPRYANVGGLLRKTAIENGLVGIVSNGFIRDIVEYKLGDKDRFFAAYAKGHTPNGPTKLEAGALNIPVKTDGYTIKSNDVFVAQGKDIVIIPAQQADNLLHAVNEGTRTMPQGAIQSHPETPLPRIASKDELSSSSSGRQKTNRMSVLMQRIKNTINRDISQLRDTPVTPELLTMMKKIPTAEYADSYSTLQPVQTTGMSLSLYPKSKERELAGLARVVEGSRKAIEKALASTGENHTLVIHADKVDDVVLDDALVQKAQKKNFAAIATNGTAALHTPSDLPVYAARFTEEGSLPKDGAAKKGKLSQIQVQGVPLHRGDVIVGDEDGIVAIPQGLEEFGMRGGHAVAAKEKETLKALSNGTAAKRTLPHGLYPSSDLANAGFLREHIEQRSAPVNTARGSSGLAIPQSRGIQVASGTNKIKEGEPLPLLEPFTDLQEHQSISGIPTGVFFDKADPALFAIKPTNKSSDNPDRISYVKGIQKDNFLRAMEAKAKQQPIKVDANGTVTKNTKL